MNENMNVMLKEVAVLKEQLSALRPLPEEALKKIQDALDIEYTYESNRIEGNTLTLQGTALVVNEALAFPESPCVNNLEATIIQKPIPILKI